MNQVNDRWLFYLVYPLMGISIVHIGNDNRFFELLSIPSYYSDIAISLAVIFLIGFYLRKVFYLSDLRFDWKTQLPGRIKFQLVWALTIPVIFAVGTELLYLNIIDIPIRESPIFYLELPIIVIYFILINLIYLIMYYRMHNHQLQKTLEEQLRENEMSKERYVIANQGGVKVNVPNKAIAYFIVKNKLTFLVTHEGKSYIFDKTLSELADILPSSEFFHINRQVIARRNSVIGYAPTETRRLKIELAPPSELKVYLPKTKAPVFVKWLEQGALSG